MTESPPLPHAPRRVDRWLMVLATGLGTGFSPKAPGTIGSLLGPLLVWLLGADGQRPLIALSCSIAGFFIGVPICNAGVRMLNLKDPQSVVFDEIAAFFWVFLFAPLNATTAVVGFLLFRLFDILKPWPIRKLEWLPRGWGVMADDAAAGLLAGVLLGIAWRLYR